MLTDKEEQPTSVWSQLNSDAQGRYLHASVTFKHFLIAFGGAINDSYLNDAIGFNTQNNAFTPLESYGDTPIARSGHTMCMYTNDRVIIFGGWHSNILNDIEIMTIHALNGVPSVEFKKVDLEDGVSPYRAYHTSHIFQNKMFVFGGKDQTLKSTNELWCLDLENSSWIQYQATGDVPERRNSHSSVICNHKMYVFGGYSSRNSSSLNDFYWIDLETLHWNRIRPSGLVPGPRYGMSMQEGNERLWVFGGYKENEAWTNELFVYDISHNSWNMIPHTDESPARREYHTAALLDHTLYIFGGRKWLGGLLSDIHALKLDSPEIEEQVHFQKEKRNDILKTKKKMFNLKNLFLQKHFADVVFQVENLEFPAHRNILAESCKYFKNMFTSGMTEAHAKKIVISDVKAATFRAFLEFIYCEQIKANETLALDLLQLSDKYSLYELKHECEELLGKKLTENNLSKFAHAADLFGASKLMEYIIKFVEENKEKLKHRADVKELHLLQSPQSSKSKDEL